MLKKEELGDELCKFCPRDEDRRGVYSVPGGFSAGCEGQNCDDAYERYLEENLNSVQQRLCDMPNGTIAWTANVIRNILGFFNYSFSAKNRFASCSPKTERQKKMSNKFFRQEYRGFYIMQVHWSHPEIGDNLKHFTMEEIEGQWAGHTIGAKMTVPQCEKFIDQLLSWCKENLAVKQLEA
jgi:hypothetical protein